MNFNAIIAILILKGVITEDEGNALVTHLNDKPQSTVLSDSIAAVAEVIGKPQNAALPPQLGPVGPAQHAEEMAARSAQPTSPVAPPPAPLEPANTQGTGNVTGPDQSANEASLESGDTSHDLKSETAQNLEERHDKNERPANAASDDEVAAHREADKPGGSTYTPERDKDTKASSVKKSTDTADKK